MRRATSDSDQVTKMPEARPLSWWVRHRTLVSMFAHMLLFVLCLFTAFCLAYNFKMFGRWFVSEYLTYLPLTLVIKLSVFGWMRLYRDSWRYVGLRDLFSIIRASHFSIFICVVVYYVSLWIWRIYSPVQQ